MPRLWTETIESHRHAVRDAVIDVAAGLATDRGLRSVTMSSVAEATGIGRATLYRYFADVESILLAWHERQITAHLQQLAEAAERGGTAGERLEAVLEAYAFISRETRGHDDSELAAFLHGGAQVARADQRLRHLLRRLVVDAATAGDVRDDVSPDEIVTYCLHALTAARALPSKAAVRRLVTVTVSGMRPPT